MSWIVFRHRFIHLSLATAALLLSVPTQAIAQLAPDPAADQEQPPLTVASVRLRPELLLPDLPPIQPILPEIEVARRLVLRLGERRVYVYEGDEVAASYPVAIGRAGWETPTGSFEVTSMLQNPGWTNPFTGEVLPPGPDNPLGERWIAFWTDGNNFIGFHGTPNRESVGRAASHGCVRMYNEHIREMYELVKVGTPVIVEN